MSHFHDRSVNATRKTKMFLGVFGRLNLKYDQMIGLGYKLYLFGNSGRFKRFGQFCVIVDMVFIKFQEQSLCHLSSSKQSIQSDVREFDLFHDRCHVFAFPRWSGCDF
jgi:hypothetical protein